VVRTLLKKAAVRPVVAALAVTAVAGALVVVQAQPPAKAAVQRVAAAKAAVALGSQSPVVSSISHTTGALDVFGVDAAQRIYSASWEPGDMNGWQRNVQLNGGVAAPGTSVHAVARRGGIMDVFAVGTDMRVWTAHWESSFGAAWQGWSALGSLKVAPNTSVHAVKSHADRMDIFAVGTEHKVYTNRWTTANGWSGWTKLDGYAMLPNTSVYAVTRDRSTVDVFAINVVNRVVWNTFNGSAWEGWRSLDSEYVQEGAVYPVSRTASSMDIFTVASTGHIITRSWTRAAGWGAWQRVLGGRAAPGTTVFGTARNNRQIDVFAVGTNRDVYTAAWNQDSGWAGWWNIGSRVAPGSSVFAHSRGTDLLDIFTNIDGAGTKTVGWSPSRGWGPWFEVGPRGEGGVSAELTADIEFEDTSADGWARLRIYSTGHYRFEGHYHFGGLTGRDIGFAWTIMTPTGHVFAFTSKATVGGISHDNDFDWDRSGYDPELHNHWAEIMNEGIWWWKARTSLNVSAIISDLMASAGYVMQAAKVIVAVA